MKTFLFIIATCIAISFAGDCNNPLLKQANNPLITSTTGILTEPVTAASPLKFCPRLAGKQICCDATAQDSILAAFKAKYDKFDKGRKEQVGAMDKAEKDSKDNEEVDAEFAAELTEIYLEGSETRLLEVDEVSVAIKALRSLRFLAEKKGGSKPEGGAKPKPSGEGGEKKPSTRPNKKSGDTRSDADASAGKKSGRGKEQRAVDIEGERKKQLNSTQKRTKDIKGANDKLKKEQGKCFRRVFKFAAGMMCLACDANYADVVSTAADGTVQIKVKSKSCDNLQSNCYGYMLAREEAGAQVNNAIKSRKGRKGKGDMDKAKKNLEDCLNDKTGCDSAQQSERLGKLQTEMNAAGKVKPTKDDKKEIEGDANMVVKRPSSCTSETNCKFICEEFVGVGGAKDEAVDLTKATDTSARRQLATGSLVYGDSGYEADSDENSKGGATETYTSTESFPDEITAGAGSYVVKAFTLVTMLAYLSM